MLHTFAIDQIGEAIDYFDRRGYVILRSAFPAAIGESFWRAVEENIERNAELRFTQYGQIYRQQDLTEELRSSLPRIIDIQGHVPIAAHLILCEPISASKATGAHPSRVHIASRYAT